MNDQLHADFVGFLSDNVVPQHVSHARNFKRDAQKYDLKAERLWRDGKPCVLESELDELWQSYHELLHHDGVGKTVKNIKSKYYFWGARTFVEKRIKNCAVTCHRW